MANKKISQLDAAAALTGTEVAPLVQSGGNVKATIQQITTAVTGATGTNGETVTTDKPRLDLTQTWNAVGTTFTGLRFNATNTASAANSRLIDLQVGGVSQASISTSGVLFVNSIAPAAFNVVNPSGATGVSSPTFPSGNFADFHGVRISANNPAGFIGSFTLYGGSGNFDANVILLHEGANIFSQRRTTNAQTFRIYNTFTDASNYERGKMEWASNVLRIGTEKAGTGTARALEFQTDGTTRLTLGTAGEATFTSSVLLGLAGNLRTRYLSNSGNILNMFDFVNDGTGTATYAVGGSSPLLRFGGTTSSFPALKRDTVSLQARLADDSAFTNIQGKLTTETAYTAGAPTATGYLVLYDSNGTAYKVPAEAL